MARYVSSTEPDLTTLCKWCKKEFYAKSVHVEYVGYNYYNYWCPRCGKLMCSTDLPPQEALT